MIGILYLLFFSNTDEYELVLEALSQGKVVLNRQNISDSSRSQLWRQTVDGYIENVGFNQRQQATNNNRSSTIYVLDVLDSHNGEFGYPLMLKAKNRDRDRFQIWTFTIVSLCKLSLIDS